MGLPHPFEVLNVFGGKSISLAPRAFIFGEKRVFIEMHKWWNFGADISNHFLAIQNLLFCLSSIGPLMLNLRIRGPKLKRQNSKFWIAGKWLEISAPKFYHLCISIKTHFSPNMKALGNKEMDFPPKMFKTSNGRSRHTFWATPSKFGEISFLS